MRRVAWGVLALLLLVCAVHCTEINPSEEEIISVDDHIDMTNQDTHPPAEEEQPNISVNAGVYTTPYEDLDEEEKQARYQKFFEWLRSEGVEYGGDLIIDTFDSLGGQRGLKTQQPIAADSLFLRMPQHVMISTLAPIEGAPSDTPFCDLTRRWSHKLIEKVFEEPPLPFDAQGNEVKDERHRISSGRTQNMLLALCLIHETKKSGGSFYQPYLNILPQQFSQPLTWKKSSLEHLQGSPLLPAVHSAKKQLEDDYRLLAEILFTHPQQGFTFEHYTWAMLTVASRTTEITFPGRKTPVRALVPILDLMNYNTEHSVAKLTNQVKLKEGMVDFVISNAIEANEQVFTGNLCTYSDCFALNHGFLPSVVPEDYIPLTLVSPVDNTFLYDSIIQDHAPDGVLDGPTADLKNAILVQNQLFSARLGPTFVDSLVSIFRLMCAPMSYVERLVEEKSFARLSQPASLEVEDCTEHSLTDLLQETLRSYPTSLQFDKLLLNHAEHFDSEKRLAIQVRIREKEILHDVLGQVELYFNK